MVSFRFWLISCTARFLLRLAVVTIRLMQWLYRNRLIGQPATEHFFRAAKWLSGRPTRSQQEMKGEGDGLADVWFIVSFAAVSGGRTSPGKFDIRWEWVRPSLIC